MFEIFAILLAFIGSTVAGIWDLFTTEVPDEVLAVMISFGIFTWYIHALTAGDFVPLFFSLTIGTFVLALGLILYKFGHWGGADAWLLAAIAYIIPIYNGGIFMFDYIFNFLIVSSAYMIIYASILGIMNRGVFSYFVDDIKNNWKILAFILVILWGSLIIFVFAYRILTLPLIEVLVLITLLVLFWRYAKVIDKRVFRKRVRTSELRVGDVLDDMIWKGITESDIKRIRRDKKFVVIKEGIRLVPAFPIALVVTLLFGNLMVYII